MKRDAQPMTQQPDQVAAAKPCEDDLFENSVAGNISWIYSMAYRQLADASLADDATQAVFLALWRKRGSLKKPIGGLLVRATRYACNDIEKSERRRKNRERKAANMRDEETQGSAIAAATEESKLAQLLALDAALQRLSSRDRDMLVARYFQNQSARQMAQTFNISEAAAEKRITRAVIKLRGIMARKKITMDSTALAALLSSGAGTAPNGLLPKVLQGVSGKAPVSLTTAHAARSIAFHTAHIPAIAGTAAVALAVSVAAVVPLALKVRQMSVQPTPMQAATGVLTCVAYNMLVQRDFAWAVKAGGKLLSGKSGGVRAYDISARVVRALVRAQSGGGRVLMSPGLARFVPLVGVPNSEVTQPGIFGSFHLFMHKNVAVNLMPELDCTWRGQTFPHFMRIQLKFSPRSNLDYTYLKAPRPLVTISVPYVYQGTLNVKSGRAVVLLRRTIQFRGTQWYSALVFEVQRYPRRLLTRINQIIDFATDAERYIQTGPAGLQHSAEVAVAWKAYALARPAIPKPQDGEWTKTFPGGASVTLDRVSNGSQLYSWTPTGEPFPGLRNYYLGVGETAALLKFKPPTNQAGNHPGIRTDIQRRWVPIMGKIGTLLVGFDSGGWRIIRTATPITNPASIRWRFVYMGHRFGDLSVTPQIAKPAAGFPSNIHVSWSTTTMPAPNLSDQAIAVGAVNRQGKLIAPHPIGYWHFQISRGESVLEYSLETIPISPRHVKRYVWITRPRYWVAFRDFALKPSVSPSAVLAMELRSRAAPRKAGPVAKPIVRIAADQTTPAGLMLLIEQDASNGHQAAALKLFYAPTAAEQWVARQALAEIFAPHIENVFQAEAKARFGIARLRAAGLGYLLGREPPVRFPAKWKNQGQYATPAIPLLSGVRWPPKGPLHKLIKINGLWYFDVDLTKSLAAKIQAAGSRLRADTTRAAKCGEAYKAVLTELQAGKIKDAYALRDALEAALKKYSEPTK
ncbi:MAG: sigma-70 family RNA polymerase sigma factor [Planctomycetia bacterium]|nr:sigma-70 family RNA polymerase sigma factor [Planctomycetia bacterium]